MKKLFLSIILVISLLIAYAGYAEESISWMPKWNVGDWWVMQKYSKKEDMSGQRPEGLWVGPDRYKFTVKAIENIDGADCYVLEVNIIEENKFYFAVAYYEVKNLRFVKLQYQIGESIKPAQIIFYNKFYLYPCPSFLNYQEMFSMPVFPIDISKNTNQKFKFEEINTTYTQTVKIITDSEANNIIEKSIPSKSQKSIIIKKPIDGKSGLAKSHEIDNVYTYLTKGNKILLQTEECIIIDLEKYAPIKYNPMTNVREYITRQFRQIWNKQYPWPVYIEIGDGSVKYYLEDCSR